MANFEPPIKKTHYPPEHGARKLHPQHQRASNKPGIVSKILLPAFGENFTIITDSPGTARTAALLLFGTASPETAPSGPDTLTSPDTIHIFQSQRYSPPPPGTMPLAYGKNPNESMLYQPSNREAFLSIPEDPRGAIRTTMLGLSAYIRNALKRRGLFFIHAAAVEISGSAAAFIGENETGKSTLARYLAARGNPLLSDDLLPVRGGGEIAVENNPAPFNPSGLPPGILDSLKQLGYNNCGYENFILPPPAPRAYPLKTAFLPRWGETTGIESAGGFNSGCLAPARQECGF